MKVDYSPYEKRTYEVEDFSEFLNYFEGEDFDEDWVFRAQPSDKDLTTTLERTIFKSGFSGDIDIIEKTMLREFRRLYDGQDKEHVLKVGAAIEEIDILDIEKYVQQTSKQDIEIVYENLLKRSRNHLRSFVSVMDKRGLTYEPQYISTEQYNEITTSDIERGGK